MVVAVECWNGAEDQVKSIVEENALEHPVLLMGGDAAQQYHVSGVPCRYYVDHQGNVVDREVGFASGHENAMMQRIEKLLTARNGQPPTERPYVLPEKPTEAANE